MAQEFWGSERKEIVERFDYRGFLVAIENCASPEYNPIYRVYLNGIAILGTGAFLDDQRQHATSKIDRLYDYAMRESEQVRQVADKKGGYLRHLHSDASEVLDLSDIPGDLVLKALAVWAGRDPQQR